MTSNMKKYLNIQIYDSHNARYEDVTCPLHTTTYIYKYNNIYTTYTQQTNIIKHQLVTNVRLLSFQLFQSLH